MIVTVFVTLSTDEFVASTRDEVAQVFAIALVSAPSADRHRRSHHDVVMASISSIYSYVLYSRFSQCCAVQRSLAMIKI